MSVEELDFASVRSVLESERRGVLIDFWSPWCAPCRVLRPHLTRLSEERASDWRFVAVNTEAHPAAAEEFSVSALPTIVWYRKGEEIARLASGVTLSAVAERLDDLGKKED